MGVCYMQRKELRVEWVEMNWKFPEKTADFSLVLYSSRHPKMQKSFLSPTVLQDSKTAKCFSSRLHY